MMTRLLAALPFLALAGPALAQGMACADHATLSERLADTWGESRQSIGLGADGAVMEVFASEETGTWTIAVTRPGGPTCIVAAGEHFEAVSEDLPPQGEGA
jgi:hypothetical protein